MKWLPFTRAGRQSLVYILFAGCGPILTVIVIWAMQVIRTFPDTAAQERLDKFSTLAILVCAGLLVMVTAYACFVSIRAVKIGKDGLEAEGNQGEGE